MAATTAIHFREATAADVPRIQLLVQSAFRGRGGWTTEADYLAGPRIDDAGILAKMNAPESALLLATTTDSSKSGDEQILACCEVALSQPPPESAAEHQPQADAHAYFGLFAVLPTQQGSGLGRRLLAHAETYCRTRWGVGAVEMKVIASRAELVAWYVRRGYARTGRTVPFPFAELEKVEGTAALKGADELEMLVLRKELVEEGEGGCGGEESGAAGVVVVEAEEVVQAAVGSLMAEKEAEVVKGVVSTTATEVAVAAA